MQTAEHPTGGGDEQQGSQRPDAGADQPPTRRHSPARPAQPIRAHPALLSDQDSQAPIVPRSATWSKVPPPSGDHRRRRFQRPHHRGLTSRRRRRADKGQRPTRTTARRRAGLHYRSSDATAHPAGCQRWNDIDGIDLGSALRAPRRFATATQLTSLVHPGRGPASFSAQLISLSVDRWTGRSGRTKK